MITILIGMRSYLIIVLISISLIIYNAEHLFQMPVGHLYVFFGRPQGWGAQHVAQTLGSPGRIPSLWCPLQKPREIPSFPGSLLGVQQDHLPSLPTQLHVKVVQSCPTLQPHPWTSLPGSSIHGILQARILELVAFPFSRGSSQFRDSAQVYHIEGRLFTSWAMKIFLYSPGCRRAIWPDSGLLSMSAAPCVLYFWWVFWGTWAQHPPPPPSWSLATLNINSLLLSNSSHTCPFLMIRHVWKTVH